MFYLEMIGRPAPNLYSGTRRAANLATLIGIKNKNYFKTMRILTLLSFLISASYVHAQDSLESHIENGKLFGIFPIVENHVVYADSIVLSGSVTKDSLYDKAKAFFDKKEDAKYYFESEDKDAGELIYQGELNKTAISVISKKSDVHFSVALHFTDSSCRI